MSSSDVHGDEMPSAGANPGPLDEAAVEAFLAGRTNDAATGELGPLTAFAQDLWAAVDEPVPPSKPELAALMAEGLSTEKGDLPATAGSNVTGPAVQAAGPPNWRTKRMTVSELLAGLTAKLAGMGLAAKAALGLGVVAMATTSAAAAGVLPDPAQHAVASAVNAISPFDVPDGTSARAEAGDEGEPGTTTTTTPETSTTLAGGGDDETDGAEAGTATNHGACVSETAKSASRGPGGAHGKAVSEVARSDCGKESAGPTTTTSVSTTVTTVDTDGEEESDRGPGNGNGNRGSGNRGSGSGSGPGSSSGAGGSGGSKGGN